MIKITDHPIWKQVRYYKKPFHLARIYLAKQYAKLFPKDTFIAVTGSVGKTTTIEACKQVLSLKYKIISTSHNLNPILNIPITILKLNPFIKRAILEMGVEYKGEMDFYLSIAPVKKAIVTRISFAHSQFLGDVQEIAEEKGKLIESLPKDGLAILNYDDLNTRKLAEKSKAAVFYYGFDSKECHLWAGNVAISNFKTTFELNYGVERVMVNYNLLGSHNVYSALAAASLGLSEGIPLTKIKFALEQVQPSPHRLTPLLGPNESIILDDTYNSSPAALEEAIDTLFQIPGRRRVLVLGEMRELGNFSEKLHRQIARKIYKEKVDLVFLGQGEANIIADELKVLGFLEDRMQANLQNPQIISKLIKILSKGDVCLIKGSRAVRLDEVVKRITRKGR